MIMIYQYIGFIVGILGIIVSILRFRDGKMSINMLMVWSGIWILLIIFSIYPDVTSLLSGITGIGRGLDIILIFGLIGCFYLIFRMYSMIESIDEEVTSLVKEIALQRGQTEEKDENDEN